MLKHIPFYASLLDRPLIDKNKSKASHVLVYGAIEAHAMGTNGQCTASNATIAAETGLKQNSVATVISTLSRSGWVKVHLNKNNQRTGVDPLMVIEPPLNHHLTPLKPPFNKEDSNTTLKKIHTSSRSSDATDLEAAGAAEQTPLHSPSPPLFSKASQDKELEAVFNQLSSILHPKQKILFTNTRKSKLKQRNKNFSYLQMMTAARNLIRSPWHMGENPGNKKYASLDFLIRNDEQVEKWLNEKPAPKKEVIF